MANRVAALYHYLLLLYCSCLGATVMTGCSVLKARPAEDAGFLAHPKLLKEMSERAPFHAGYVPDVNRLENLKKEYRKIYIEPVVTEIAEEKLRKRDLLDSIIAERIADLRELAKYFEERIRTAFEEFEIDKQDKPLGFKKFEVVTVPTDDTFVWQIAIIDISPNVPELAIAGTAAGFFIPGGGAIRALGAGSIAIEGIVRDGRSGDVLAEFRDREADKTAPVSIRDFEMYAHIRRSLDDWAEQFAELAGTTVEHTVDDSSPFTLNPF
jgi:hypothetical protein